MGCKTVSKKPVQKVDIDPSLIQVLQAVKPFDNIPNTQKLKGTLVKKWFCVQDPINSYEKYYYRGQWSDDVPHGEGFLYRKRKEEMIFGYFNKGMIARERCYKITADKTKYIGPINESNQMHGYGFFESPTFRYMGNIQEDVFDGKGIYKTAKQSKIGYFRNNKLQEGRIITEKGMFEGKFTNERLQGIGTYVWKDGGKYVGEFKDGFKDGRGVLFNKEGEIVRVGNWVEDEMFGMDELRNSNNMCGI